MRRSAIVTMASMLIQAAGSLIMILTLASLLPAPEFVLFSFVISTAMFSSTITFEWLRLGSMRHFPGSPGEEQKRLANIIFASLCSSVALVFFIIVVWFSGVVENLIPKTVLLPLICLGVLQGITDLLFMLIRFLDRLLLSSILQIIRAVSMSLLTITVGWITQNGVLSIWALVGGYCLSITITLIVFPIGLTVSPKDIKLNFLSKLVRQGIASAGASQVHFTVLYGIRFIGATTLGPSSIAAAAFLLALDIIQRPFPMLGTLITVLFVPELNRNFDNKKTSATKKTLKKIYDLLMNGSIIGGTLLILIIPTLSEIAVPLNLQYLFNDYSYPLIVFFAALLALQTGAAIVPQLIKKPSICLKNAIIHLSLSIIFYGLGKLLVIEWLGIIWLMIVAVVVTFLFALPKSMFIKVGPSLMRMFLSLIMAIATLTIVWFYPASDSIVNTLAVVALLGTYALFLFDRIFSD